MNKCKTIDCNKETTHHIRVKQKDEQDTTLVLMCCDNHVRTIQEDMKEFIAKRGLEIEVIKLH